MRPFAHKAVFSFTIVILVSLLSPFVETKTCSAPVTNSPPQKANAEVVPKGKPIPTSKDASTWEQEAQRRLEWLKRELVTPYDTKGNRNQKWDVAAKTFLADAVEWLAQTRNAPSHIQLLEAADEVLALGCNDGAVAYLSGLVRYANRSDHMYRITYRLERSVNAFKTNNYSRAMAFRAAT